MVRRFRTETFVTEEALERWLNEMAERPEDSPRWRHQPSRQLKIESISGFGSDSPIVILAVISRLEDDDGQ